MPTYEYECKACGHRFERQQRGTDAPVAECPECRGEVRRLISGGAGFIVKGGTARGSGGPGGSCSLESTGRTCCGSDHRCGKPCDGK
jgi:putative FmdB family regulatory protein